MIVSGKFNTFFYLILLGFAQICYGQVRSTPLHFDQLTIGDGLSHNTTNCILQDQYGYIWIGTQDGLNKYDGYSFEVYRSNEAKKPNKGFVGKNISCLFEDRAGNLWVGTRKHGINLRGKSSDQFVNLRTDSSFIAIRDSDISSIFEDASGDIWVTTVGAGVLRYNPRDGSSRLFNQQNSHLSSDVTFDVVEDQYGTLWVAAAGGGINYLVDHERFQLSHEMLPNHPNMSGYRKKMYLDNEYLWVGTEGTGLYKMNLKDRSYVHFAPGNGKHAISSYVVRDICKTQDGRLFIATDGGGLNIYDPRTEDITVFNYQEKGKTSLNSNALFCLLEDRTGNIWIGSYNGGLNIYKPQKTWFDFLAPTTALGDETLHRSILSIFQRRNGDILLGTDRGGLYQLDPNPLPATITPFMADTPAPQTLAGNVVKTIFEDRQGRLWIGMFGEGLDLFDPQSRSFQHIIQEQISVWSIAEQGDGQLLVATMGNGIRLVDPETLEVSTFLSDSTDTNIITTLIDRNNRIWIGTADNGLEVWDNSRRQLSRYQYNPWDSLSLSDDEIRTIFEDSDGDIWIGTEGRGLNRWLGNGQFGRIEVEDGLIANSVMGITEDVDGALWISTYKGISRLDKASGSIQNFDFRRTAYLNQFNQGAILQAANGMLLFGGINGLHTIHPKNVRPNRQEGELLFTDLKIYNRSVPVGELSDGRVILEQVIEESKDIWLSYLDQSFSIAFTTTDYTNPQGNEFSYQMEGFHDAWQYTAAGQRSVTYTNLHPGTYVFRVKHQHQQAAIRVHISPPYWQTLWFKALISILSLGVIVSGLFIWINRREAANKRQILQLQNEKLATEVETKNSKLMFSSIQIAHKNEILTEVIEDLVDLEKAPEKNFRFMIQKLDRELKNEDYWKEFNLYFNEANQKFLDRLVQQHPNLTQNDIRLCSLLRMNLSTKEIASLLNVSTRGVEQSRYRLKKRLGLGTEEDLSKYITFFQ
jgi:ligand-binding sensor domain-containing protein/DNA-binding CsgD family transcriptional regulator